MYKVYIADDETIIRNGLINGIDWTGLDCQVAGSAPDGRTASREILELRPDILLTDIKMPFLDGLEMITLLRKNLPELYIIVITGYSEFSFAQKAVKLGVYDFILKPIDIDYLCKVILDIENKIKACRFRQTSVPLYSNFPEELSVPAPQTLWNVVFSPSSADFWGQSENISPDLSFCQCMILQIDDYFRMVENMTLEEQKELERSICECISDAVKDLRYVYSLARGNAEFLFVFFSETAAALKACREKATREIRLSLNKQLHYTATAGIGTVMDNPERIRQSYLEAEESLQYKFMYGNSSDLFFSSLDRPPAALNYNYISSMQTVISSIVSGNPEQAIEEAEKSLSFAPGSNSLYGSVRRLTINNIVWSCIELLSAVNLSLYEIFPDFFTIYRELISAASDSELKSRLTSLIRQVSNIYVLTKNNLTAPENPIVADAKAYIEKHYSDCRLHLSRTAEALSVSSCYLSNIFKQETGKTYIDYLTSVRISKAKELLADPQVKIYEVCYLSGYDNPTYFSTLFKRRTGLTPSEYRNRMSIAEKNPE